MCMKLHWGPCNCAEKESQAQTRRGHYEWVNPRSLGTLHRVDRDAQDERDIQHYERHPDRSLDGGEPWVRQGLLFRGPLQNGHHRREAAIRRGRKLRIWVAE